MTAVSLSLRFAQRSHSMKFSFISDKTTHSESDNNDDDESVDKLLVSILSVSCGLQHSVGDKLVVVHPFYYYVIDDEVSAWNL